MKEIITIIQTLLVKMDMNKISQIVEKAKKTYTENKNSFDKVLVNRPQYYQQYFSQSFAQNSNLQQGYPMSGQNLGNSMQQPMQGMGGSSMDYSNSGFPSQQPQASSAPYGGGGYGGSPFNVVGNNSGLPINIIAKNYINPNSFDEDEEAPKEETKSKNLAKIPDNLLKNSTTDWEPINYRGVNVGYDLYELAKVEINFDEIEQKLIYKIIEPQLTDEEKGYFEELKKGFIYVFEKVSPDLINMSGKELIVEGAKRLASKYRIKMSEEQFRNISYYLVRDFLGLDLIEPIMHDPYIEDISCDGLNVPIFVNHLKYGPLEVNRSYSEVSKLNSFIIKLAQKSNQEISLSKPILQGALPDGSRVEAIYGKEVSEKGSSFTIRKFREEPFTPIHLIEFGTMPPFMLAYLWLAVENKQSILVSGGTATGKTTILNALSLFVPPTSKVVSIEDTPEINLPHEHWLPMVARESDGKSQVSMFDLLKASLRERPDYIIVGEIRGKEAAILFQGMATGHAGLGTVHAERFEDLVNRMTIDPINLPKQLLTELKIVIFMKQVKVKNNVVRRAYSIVEVIDYNAKSDKFYTSEFVRYTPSSDEFNFQEKSLVISHLLELRGGKEDSLWTEIEKRRRILDYMHKKRVLEFKDVSNVIKAYYKDPGSIFEYLDSYIAQKEVDISIKDKGENGSVSK